MMILLKRSMIFYLAQRKCGNQHQHQGFTREREKEICAKAQSNIKDVGGLSRNERIPEAIVLQRANAFKSKSVNPCFVVFLSAAYVAATFMVTFLYPSQILQTSIR